MSKNVTIESAKKSGLICSGENCPNFEKITTENVIEERSKFLANVVHNGARSHIHIINVLNYMTQFINEDYLDFNNPWK